MCLKSENGACLLQKIYVHFICWDFFHHQVLSIKCNDDHQMNLNLFSIRYMRFLVVNLAFVNLLPQDSREAKKIGVG